MVFDEAELVTARLNSRMASESVLLQMAVAGVLSEEAAKNFAKKVQELSEA